MAESPTFHCTVITPERKVLECEATFVAFPAHDGEMGVLRNRAPLICKLGIGLMRITTVDETRVLFINEGFAQVVDNRLTLLTEDARDSSQINTPSTEKTLADAIAMRITDDASFVARAKALARARSQLQLAQSSA